MSAFLDEVVDPFYVPAPVSQESYSFGQVFFAHCYYPHGQMRIWRPSHYEPREGVASNFNVQPPGPDAFRKLAPYISPPLGTNEEFIVLKAKRRPVILVQPPDPALRLVPVQRGRATVARELAPVGLVYSAVDSAGDPKFPTGFLDGVRRLEYPQFLFLPKGGPVTVDSIARFDEIQSAWADNLQPTGYALTGDVTGILKSQLSFLLTGLAGTTFQMWRDELLR